MVDAEAVRRRLREIDRRLAALRAIRAAGRDRYRGDLRTQAAAERHLQLAIQSAIDISVHLLAEDTATTPDDYASAFVLVADELGVMDRALADRLRLAAGLRNILVHGYLDVDVDRVWAHLDQLDDLGAFAAAVESYLATAA